MVELSLSETAPFQVTRITFVLTVVTLLGVEVACTLFYRIAVKELLEATA
jgi:hypothetical protein